MSWRWGGRAFLHRTTTFQDLFLGAYTLGELPRSDATKSMSIASASSSEANSVFGASEPNFNDSLWISHHASRSHSPPCPFTSTLCPCNPFLKSKPNLKEKQANKQNKETKQQQQKEKDLVMEAVVQSAESHSLHFSPRIFTCKCSLL